MSPEVPIILLIISAPTYFLCRWIITKFDLAPINRRNSYVVLSTIILTPTLYVLLIFSIAFTSTFYLRSKFDKLKWENASDKRYKLSKNIIRSKMLNGKTKDEVIEVLGGKFYDKDMNSILYELGHTPGLFNIDPDYLEIIFDNGKVTDVKHIRG